MGSVMAAAKLSQAGSQSSRWWWSFVVWWALASVTAVDQVATYSPSAAEAQIYPSLFKKGFGSFFAHVLSWAFTDLWEDSGLTICTKQVPPA